MSSHHWPYNEEYFAIRREVKNGMLTPMAYMIANIGIQIPMMLVMSVCALSVSAYGRACRYMIG
jgi:hypothetical protein